MHLLSGFASPRRDSIKKISVAESEITAPPRTNQGPERIAASGISGLNAG